MNEEHSPDSLMGVLERAINEWSTEHPNPSTEYVGMWVRDINAIPDFIKFITEGPTAYDIELEDLRLS